jgi:hypothetical protein
LTDYLAGTSQPALQGVNGTSTVTTHNTDGEICDSNQIFLSNHFCHQRVQLSTQLLRVSRQIYSEAALLPYSTNASMFSGGMWHHFRTVFVQQFTDKQRRAMRIAIVPEIFLGQLAQLPRLVPDVKHLWLETPAPQSEDKGKDEGT